MEMEKQVYVLQMQSFKDIRNKEQESYSEKSEGLSCLVKR